MVKKGYPRLYPADCLKSELKPLRFRMHIKRALKFLALGMIVFSGMLVVLSLGAVFVPVLFVQEKALWAFFIVFAPAVALIPFIRPGWYEVIKTADSLGLKERVVTACLFWNDHGTVAGAQRQDAVETLQKTNFKKLYRIRMPLEYIAVSLLFILLAAGITLVPSSARDRAAEMEKVQMEIEKQVEMICEEKEKLVGAIKPGNEMQIKAERELEQLISALEKAKNGEEALKELSKAAHKLENIGGKEGNTPEAPKEAGEALYKTLNAINEAGRRISHAIDGRSRFSQMVSSDERLQQEDISNDGSQESSDGSSGNGENSESSDGSSGNGENSENSDGSSERGENSGGGEDAGDGDTANGGEGNDNGSGGELGENGSGAGSGDGQGSGAGSGSSGEETEYGPEDPNNAWREPGEGRVEDYEPVYVPERLGGNGEASFVHDETGRQGKSLWYGTELPVEKGSVVPYKSVYKQYREEAFYSIEEAVIPPLMKDIVREYFTSLE